MRLGQPMSALRDSSRALLVALVAALVTIALFMGMHLLIYRDSMELDTKPARRIVDIVMEDVQLTEHVSDELPDRPEDVPDELLAPPDPVLDQQHDLHDSALNMGLASLNPDISLQAGFAGDGEYLPIVKIAPVYPPAARSRGIEGYCIVQYIVTYSGAVRDPQVADCSHRFFERASLRASLKFKYKPRVVDGQPVEVSGVRNMFTYELED